jgi:hypothetical protein
MPYLIGTDEAGYGPNLGPLVISASVWEAPDGVGGEDLYERLDGVIASRAGILPAQKHRQDACGTVAMADSKALYQSGKGLRLLERGLWAAFALLDKRPCTCRDVWKLLAPDCEAQRQAGMCDDDGRAAPLDAAPAELIELGTRVHEGTAAAGVRLVSLQSRVVFPAEFNDTVERCGSKGLALSRWTLELAARAMAPLPDGCISILCDKHGGRDRYLPLLMEHFPEAFIEIHGEGRQRSQYCFGPAERRVEFCFQAKGEIPPRTGHEGMELVLVFPRAGPGTHGRIPQRRRSIQGRHRRRAEGTWHRGPADMAKQVKKVLGLRFLVSALKLTKTQDPRPKTITV